MMAEYTETELNIIRQAYDEMIVSIRPHISDENHLSFIEKAYRFSMERYNGKYLVSGKPYMLHLIEMSKIAVLEVGLSYITVASAFLHGITYKSGVSLSEIESNFGKPVSLIIDGFDKVSDIKMEKLSYYSDNFRILFLSVIEDMRVVLLKIVHRLYDIRNQQDIDSDRLNRYFYEIKYLYIPITHRLGLYQIKAEFEEKLMLYVNPVEYREIEEKISSTLALQNKKIELFLAPIREGLDAERERTKKKNKYKFSYSIKWRIKSIPSIYAKMRAQNVPFEQVYDLFAVRIIIDCLEKDEKECCWMTYSIVTNRYEPNPARLRDWITIPKASGYESLHTTVNFDNQNWVEVQIRSARMDDVAEKGQAAHYLYKSVGSKPISSEEWLLHVREMLENPDQIIFENSYQNGNRYKSDKIFIFTPNGDLKQLPIGSTVLDFAYEVHSQVGDTCNGAKVNGRVVPIRYVLNNGDKVEIITSKRQSPRADWLNYVTTDKAKAKIRRFLREEELKESELGRSMLQRRLKNWKIPVNEDVINLLVKEYKLDNSLQLYHEISTEEIDLADVKKFLVAELDEKDSQDKIPSEEVIEPWKKSTIAPGKDYLSIGDDIDNVKYKLAKCCNPIPGDSVFGFVTASGSISIHRFNCPNARSLYQHYSYRIMGVKWNGIENGVSQATIRVYGYDVMGLLGEITKVISGDLKVNMKNIVFNSDKEGYFEGKIVLQITNADALEQLMTKLKAIHGVLEVIRIDE
jgi:Guanosine polyphosphate pyrophosphohydrolases/synthetases